MEHQEISSDIHFEFHEVNVLDSKMAYIDTCKHSNSTESVIFLHGNPTSSYLWRNVIPHISLKARCIAPDLIGMGCSGKPTGIQYRFTDHARYLAAFLEAVIPEGNIVFVIHDWGSALGMDWARQHPDRVSGLALMEFIYPISNWDGFPGEASATFQTFRNPELAGSCSSITMYSLNNSCLAALSAL